MYIQNENLLINDYLDLYLYAGKIGDNSWQQEIIGKLKAVKSSETQTKFTGLSLYLERYKHLNNEILSIYQQMRHHSSNDHLEEQIQLLKQQRILIGRQIRFITNPS